MTKIQKESNSQQVLNFKKNAIGVVTYDKDTKRKQFTTIGCTYRIYSLVL